MAKVLDPSGSQLSGKAHGLVYVKFNGETYTRRLPQRKKDSASPGMLQNQQRFKEVNQFCSQFKESLIPQIWNGVDPKMSGYALFLKSNMAAFAKDGSLEDAKKIRLSTGKLSFPQGMEAHKMEGEQNKIEVSWPRELHVGGIHLKDELMVVSHVDGVYSPMLNTGIERDDLKGSFEIPSDFMPQVPGSLPLYLFFVSQNHKDYSESVCFEV